MRLWKLASNRNRPILLKIPKKESITCSYPTPQIGKYWRLKQSKETIPTICRSWARWLFNRIQNDSRCSLIFKKGNVILPVPNAFGERTFKIKAVTLSAVEGSPCPARVVSERLVINTLVPGSGRWFDFFRQLSESAHHDNR